MASLAGNIKVYTSFDKAFLLKNALKLNIEALYKTESLDPYQGPTQILTQSSQKQVKKL